MKKNRMLLKLVTVLLLVAMLALSLVSCGTSAAKVEDASGSHGALSWSYTKSDKTLKISGEGEMASFDSASAVVWTSVRAAVEKIVVGEGITSVGNYAFYMMSALKEVTLPKTLTSIGDYAFAFSSSLENVTIPVGVSSIGKGAFEGCGDLSAIFVPSTVTSLGERAFAYCYTMKSAMIMGEIAELKAETFKNCKALETLVVRTALTEAAVAETAFAGAKIGFADATKTDSADGSATITIRYVDADGNTLAKSQVLTVAHGSPYACNSPVVEGYTADKLTVSGTGDGNNKTETVTYTKNEVVPEPAPEPEPEPKPEEEDKPITAGTIIAIVIMAVVLIGVGVGAFLLIRSDKKTAGKNTTTVRKNQDDKKKRK